MTNLPNSLADVWEHMRRYMEEGGPPLQAGNRFRSDRIFSSREAWGAYFPLVLPNGLKRFSEQPIHSIVMLVTFPMSFLMGLSDWLAGITSRDPRWPADILKAAGGAPLSDAEIAKLIPEPDDTDEAEETSQPRTGKPRIRKPKVEDPTGGMNPRDLAAYQAKQREHYAGLIDDELESIANIATLTPPARQVLMEEMARRGITVAEQITFSPPSKPKTRPPRNG